MKRIISTVITALSLSVFGLAASGRDSAHAAAQSNLTIPVSGTFQDQCTGNLLAYTGMFHMLATSTVDSGGGVHTDMHFNGADIKAVDETTGTPYVFAYVNSLVISTSASGTTVWTFTFTFNLISQGPVSKSDFHMDFHFTNNPDGTQTTYIDHVSTTCRG